eukprot:15344973-Ditylum_brightwellii.AAC.2
MSSLGIMTLRCPVVRSAVDNAVAMSHVHTFASWAVSCNIAAWDLRMDQASMGCNFCQREAPPGTDSTVIVGGSGANLAMAFSKVEMEHVAVSIGSINSSSKSMV